MKISMPDQRLIGFLTIFSAILAFGSILLGVFAVDFDFDAFSNPAGLLRFSPNHSFAKWFMLLDLFGYYLLLLPIAFYLHDYLKDKTSWANTLTFSGLAYVLLGAIGAAILAAVWPELMQRYLIADAAQKTILQAGMDLTTWIVYGGIWNILETFLSAVWWVGLGFVMRPRFKALGMITLILGFACLLDSIGNMTGLKIMAEIGLNIYLLFAIIWAAWIGILVYRGKI